MPGKRFRPRPVPHSPGPAAPEVADDEPAEIGPCAKARLTVGIPTVPTKQPTCEMDIVSQRHTRATRVPELTRVGLLGVWRGVVRLPAA